jgi:tryptophan-rich sensory protein
MGVTAANTWHTAARTPSPRHLQRFLFAGVFATNALWSILFFGLHQPGLALLDILAYFFFLTQWIRWIARHASAREAWMQALHVGWILFATLLNFSIWWLN